MLSDLRKTLDEAKMALGKGVKCCAYVIGAGELHAYASEEERQANPCGNRRAYLIAGEVEEDATWTQRYRERCDDQTHMTLEPDPLVSGPYTPPAETRKLRDFYDSTGAYCSAAQIVDVQNWINARLRTPNKPTYGANENEVTR
jgi:hypothetical protein